MAMKRKLTIVAAKVSLALPVLSNNIIRRQPTEDATAGSAVFGLVLGFQAAHGHRSHFMYVLTPLRVARQIGSPLPVQAARA